MCDERVDINSCNVRVHSDHSIFDCQLNIKCRNSVRISFFVSKTDVKNRIVFRFSTFDYVNRNQMMRYYLFSRLPLSLKYQAANIDSLLDRPVLYELKASKIADKIDSVDSLSPWASGMCTVALWPGSASICFPGYAHMSCTVALWPSSASPDTFILCIWLHNMPNTDCVQELFCVLLDCKNDYFHSFHEWEAHYFDTRGHDHRQDSTNICGKNI